MGGTVLQSCRWRLPAEGRDGASLPLGTRRAHRLLATAPAQVRLAERAGRPPLLGVGPHRLPPSEARQVELVAARQLQHEVACPHLAQADRTLVYLAQADRTLGHA